VARTDQQIARRDEAQYYPVPAARSPNDEDQHGQQEQDQVRAP